jgi:probable phosphoglycerate mutase
MKIALVRHGQTEENFLHKIQGRSNAKLNEAGIRQCVRLKNKIKDKHFDYCYMSPMARCVETAIILIGDRVETIPDDRLMERDMGELEGRDIQEYNSYQYWDYDLNRNDRGVEALQDVFKRCKEFLSDIKKKHPKGDILIVTHSATYRALRYLIQKHALKGKMYDGYIENCQYEEYEIK